MSAIQQRLQSANGLGTVPLYLFLITDVLNGLVSFSMPGVFSPIALGIKACIAFVIAMFTKWTSWDFALVWWLLLLMAVGLLVLDLNSDSLMLLFKVVAVIFLANLLRRYLATVASRQISFFLVVCVSVLFISSALGFFGIGYERYGGVSLGLRANGFLPAGNEMNVALVGLFWWLSAPGDPDLHAPTRRILYVLCLGMMIASYSKTTVLAAGVIMLYRATGTGWALTSAILLTPICVIALLRSSLWERWLYFYHLYSDQGVLASLTSGRFARVNEIDVDLEVILSKGAGVLTQTGGYIESDILDLLYNFGTIGLLLFLTFTLGLWSLSRGVAVISILLLGISILAGHVAYSVFAMPILACCLAMAVQRTQPLRREFRTQGLLGDGDIEPQAST
jgi:hypothetical protein